MTNKEKLEIIDVKLDELYEALNTKITKDLLLSDYRNLTQAIYNLESTRLLLEPIENEQPYEIYECPECHKEQHIYGEFISGKCLYCNKDFVKKTMQ